MLSLIEVASITDLSITKNEQLKPTVEEEEEKELETAQHNTVERKVRIPPFKVSEKFTKNVKRRYSQILTIVEHECRMRSSEEESATIVPLATTSKIFKDVCGGPRLASALIETMADIGIIRVYDKTYRFGAHNKEFNRCKSYMWFYVNEKKFKEVCAKNDIHAIVLKNATTNQNKKNKPMTDIDESKIRFGIGLAIQRPGSMSVDKFEEYIDTVLHENYSQLEEFQKVADNCNEMLGDNIELYNRYKPTITWNKDKTIVTGIGIRNTNRLVAAKNTREEGDRESQLYKEAVLEKFSMSLEKDVKSSVPRVTKSINEREWIREDRDIYEEIYNKYKESNDNNDTVVEGFSKSRPAIKKLLLKVYFDRYDNRLGASLCCGRHGAIEEKFDKSSSEVIKESQAVLKVLRDSILKVIGQPLGNEIFFHESNIYLKVQERLLKEGYLVWQVYDSWYARPAHGGERNEEYEKKVTRYVEEEADKYIKKYIKSNKERKIDNDTVVEGFCGCEKSYDKESKKVMKVSIEEIRKNEKERKIDNDTVVEGFCESEFMKGLGLYM